jgi:hypothetical protein
MDFEFNHLDPTDFYSTPIPRTKGSHHSLPIPIAPAAAPPGTVPPTTHPRLRAARRNDWPWENAQHFGTYHPRRPQSRQLSRAFVLPSATVEV